MSTKQYYGQVSFGELGIGVGASATVGDPTGASASTHAQVSGAMYQEGKDTDYSTPLVIVDGYGRYNVAGLGSEGFMTGFDGRIQLGVGWQFKEYGMDGADLYVMATATTAGQAYYHKPYATQHRNAIGVETGILGQQGSVVWMLSPTVQLGGSAHYGIDDGVFTNVAYTDFIQPGLRGRVIVDDKLFASAEALYNPNMADVFERDDGTGWSAYQLGLRLHYQLSEKSMVQGYADFIRYDGTTPRYDGKDAQSYRESKLVSGDLTEASAGITYTRLFDL